MKIYPVVVQNAAPRVEEIDWQDAYERFLPRVFHFFCYKVGDPQLAEELTATSFEKAWASRASFRQDRGPLSAWILGIARNVAADHFRRMTREAAWEDAAEIPAPGSVLDDVQRRLDFQRIARRLARFPERERELVALKYGAELNNREIARMTGLTESNVGTILHRVVARLREEWEQDHER